MTTRRDPQHAYKTSGHAALWARLKTHGQDFAYAGTSPSLPSVLYHTFFPLGSPTIIFRMKASASCSTSSLGPQEYLHGMENQVLSNGYQRSLIHFHLFYIRVVTFAVTAFNRLDQVQSFPIAQEGRTTPHRLSQVIGQSGQPPGQTSEWTLLCPLPVYDGFLTPRRRLAEDLTTIPIGE